jgi:hypothetical protein
VRILAVSPARAGSEPGALSRGLSGRAKLNPPSIVPLGGGLLAVSLRLRKNGFAKVAAAIGAVENAAEAPELVAHRKLATM